MVAEVARKGLHQKQYGAVTRSPYEWMDALQRTKAEAMRGDRSKISIQDVIDRANDPRAQGSLEPTSPRSVEACLRLGIEPHELHYVPVEAFAQELGARDLATIAFKHHEAVRQERLGALLEERKRVTDLSDAQQGKGASSGAAKEAEEGMVEKEAKRLEVLQRRQARELEQLLHYEVARKAMQDKAEAKVASMEARAEEARCARAAAEAEWLAQQRERELRRAQQEAERENEVKAQEAARYAREMEIARAEAEEEKLRRKEAYAHEQERRAKVEEARAETERILRAQAAEVEAKKADMARRDAQRERAKQAQMEAAAAAALAAQQKAEARVAATLAANEAGLAQRRAAFDEKQSAVEIRNLHREHQRKEEEADKRAREAEAEAARRAAFDLALERERERVEAILSKQKAKEERLEALRREQEHKAERRALVHALDLGLKRNKVEAMRRRELYERARALGRIRAETDRAYDLLGQRAALQEARRAATMHASLQRQQLLQEMDRMQAKKAFAPMQQGIST